jgi:ABC-2 type transport system ATP-binding protein
VLLTTQYLEEADRLAASIIVIDDGGIIAEGSPSALKSRLGGTVVEICLANTADTCRAAERLQLLAPTEIVDGAANLSVKVPNKGRSVQEVMRLLDAEAIVVESLAIREPTLDDVFLQLTGHRSDPAASARPPAAVAAGVKIRGAA